MAQVGTSSTSTEEHSGEKDQIISELEEFLKFNKKDEKKREDVKPTNKRKRTTQTDTTLEDIVSIFLRIIYPLSRCMKKYLVVGLDKTADCKPFIMINDNGKPIELNELAWNSFHKRMQLIDCYFQNKIYGKKTSFTLLNSDIEIDIVLFRGQQCLRIRDVTTHDLKVLMSYEEFIMLYSSAAAINTYINQLHIVASCCKDYITSATDTLPLSHILYSPLDTSIMNRLPQEVELYRRVIANSRNEVVAVEARNVHQEEEEEDTENVKDNNLETRQT